MGRSPTKTRRAKQASGRRRARNKAMAAPPKRAIKPARRGASAATVAKAEIARLSRELSEALAQQTATSEVLQVISSSTGDLQPVFKSMLNNALQICEAKFGQLLLFDGRGFLPAELHNTPAEYAELFERGPLVPGPNTGLGRVISGKKVIHIPDVTSGSLYAERDPLRMATVEILKARSLLAVPMLKETRLVGAIVIYRQEPRPFSDRQIELVTNFAAQAVIAIENARLFNETREALERQTATSEVLQVISSSPGDLKPVFDQMLAKAMRLCEAQCGFIYLMEQGAMRAVAEIGVPPAFAEYRRNNLHTGGVATPVDVMRATKKPAHVHDARDSEPYRSGNPNAVAGVDLGGARTVLYVPMIRNDDIVGVINVYRQEVKPFTDEQIALLENFASQAVIAIENARLFNETNEALERQTATADILKVIASSPDDVQPVFDAIAQSARRVIGGYSALVTRLVGEGIHLAAFTSGSEAGREKLTSTYPQPLSSQVLSARVLRTGKVIFYADTETDADEITRGFAGARGYRSVISVPMLRDGAAIGTINVTRVEPGTFDENTIGLLKTFADQAVIAIENARLFNETTEALAHQTATSEVLETIGSSMADTQPVFERILDSVERLFEVRQCSVILARDQMLHLVARRGIDIEGTERLFPAPIAGTAGGAVIRAGRQTYVPSSASAEGSSLMRRVAEVMGDYSVVMTPLVWEGQGIGMISAARAPNASFSDKELALLRTFADQAVIAIENARLFNETKEALAQQTATSEVLSVISSSVADTAPVFEKILDSCEKLFATEQLGIFVVHPDGQTHVGAWRGEAVEAVIRSLPRPVEETATGVAIQNRAVLHIPNTATAQDVPPTVQFTRDQYGDISIAWAPMLTEEGGIGSIAVMRQPPNPFSDKELALLKTFADQAVIAIQNTRLFNETKEALARQTATADVLKVIASSPSNLQPVFDAIAERSKELIGAHATTVSRHVDGMLELAAFTPVSPEADATLRKMFPRSATIGEPRADEILRGEITQIVDVEREMDEPGMREIARARGWRSRLMVPLKDGANVVGWISNSRKEAGAFAEQDIELLQTFADQAVIAIKNVELFEEVQARTRDLEDALEQQTATADVLKVISRSAFDIHPVLRTLVESAARLCQAETVQIFLRDDELYRLVAHVGFSPEYQKYAEENPIAPGRGTCVARTALELATVHIPDVLLDTEYTWHEGRKLGGYRAMLGVPLLREQSCVGVMAMTRMTPRPFTNRQIELVRVFADQAVIAIENTRLFNETKEALARQTATADVLKVIASSPSNLQPVFDAIAERSKALIGGHSTTVFRFAGDMVELVAATSVGAEADAVLRATFPMPISRMQNIDRVLRGEIAEIVDAMAGSADDASRNVALARGWRSRLVVPLKGDNEVIGFISITRKETGGFADKDVELVRTFADQAVIAIQNVELFEEVQNRTQELSESLQFQTATSDVLKVISRSPDKLEPVLDAIVETSRELCGSDASTIFLLRDDGMFHFAAIAGTAPKHLEDIRTSPMNADAPGSLFGRLLRQKRTLHYANIMDDPELRQGRSAIGGPRALLVAPLINTGEVIGAIVLRQSHLKPFTERQIQAIEVFADQAVIAISNVGLFEQVQQRTRELSQSLDDLRTAQDRLIQTEKLASLGQLTAGIAHEIKNPLNFVNNFSALSVELTDELNDVLKQAELAGKLQQEVNELTQLLKSNLEKVVQHGKRADSIVKNMLLHSREGSGEQRAADINTLVEESLNLAYHGARAEKSGFNITLQREFDAGAGSAELFPQEITRALLNLISNGFYAATRRKADNGDEAFEPMLLAMTKDLGASVEIRIRDNGTGIPPEVKEKMFNPFFTTKPAGEGTGLGLSMTHDIIVKQHGGTIDVATEPGKFTEFIVVLPRANGAQTRNRGQA